MRRGRLDEKRTYDTVQRRLAQVEHAVVPGFYGSLPDGRIKTFSRGGSDITGSIVARGSGAAVYENWTDVAGLLMADPRIVENPRIIDSLTYSELRELSYMGAHRAARRSGLPRARGGHPGQHPQHQQPRSARHDDLSRQP